MVVFFWRRAWRPDDSKMRTPNDVPRYSSGKAKEQNPHGENRPRVQIRGPIAGHAEGASSGDSD